MGVFVKKSLFISALWGFMLPQVFAGSWLVEDSSGVMQIHVRPEIEMSSRVNPQNETQGWNGVQVSSGCCAHKGALQFKDTRDQVVSVARVEKRDGFLRFYQLDAAGHELLVFQWSPENQIFDAKGTLIAEVAVVADEPADEVIGYEVHVADLDEPVAIAKLIPSDESPAHQEWTLEGETPYFPLLTSRLMFKHPLEAPAASSWLPVVGKTALALSAVGVTGGLLAYGYQKEALPPSVQGQLKQTIEKMTQFYAALSRVQDHPKVQPMLGEINAFFGHFSGQVSKIQSHIGVFFRPLLGVRTQNEGEGGVGAAAGPAVGQGSEISQAAQASRNAEAALTRSSFLQTAQGASQLSEIAHSLDEIRFDQGRTAPQPKENVAEGVAGDASLTDHDASSSPGRPMRNIVESADDPAPVEEPVVQSPSHPGKSRKGHRTRKDH